MARPAKVPNANGVGTVSYASFEKHILPYYHMTMPCDTDDVHYADSEPIVGQEATLYLSFTTSPRCLQEFVGNLSEVRGPVPITGGDDEFPYEMRQDQFGWLFDQATTYNVYTGAIDAENTVILVEDNSAQHLVVRLIVHHV
jgi:hypothetical protein